jgi:hypothetical protein
MSQVDVIEVLEKYKKPLSRTDIAKILNESVILVSHAIARLIKGREIKIIEIDRNEAMRLYHCKRRMRLYYI